MRAKLDVYICTEYPSYSETFVQTEAEELRRLGRHVLVFPLRGGNPYLPNQDNSFGRRWPLSIFPLALPIVSVLVLRAIINRGLRFQLGNFSRVAYAAFRASELWLRLLYYRHFRGMSVVFHPHFLDRPTDVALMARNRNDVVVATAHAGDSLLQGDPSLWRWRASAADGIICASAFVEKNLESTIPGLRSQVIHCGVELPQVRRGHGLCKTGVVRLCTVGRLVHKKNHRYAAAVALAIARTGWKVTWDVVGDGDEMSWLRSFSDDAPANLRVLLHGALPHGEALDILSRADVFILPSRETQEGPDGIPVSLMEAMARGILTVSLPVAGIPELVKDGVTGLLGEACSPEDCARRLMEVLEDGSAYDELTTGGVGLVEREFHARTNAERVVRWVDEVAGVRVSDE